MKKNTNSRMQAGSGIYKCGSCGKRTRETGNGESYVGLCYHCYECGSWINSVMDGMSIDEVPEEYREEVKKETGK
jgi:DNA-directed RNA polymerase subunit RPC12/RpoP